MAWKHPVRVRFYRHLENESQAADHEVRYDQRNREHIRIGRGKLGLRKRLGGLRGRNQAYASKATEENAMLLAAQKRTDCESVTAALEVAR